ncbi:MAG: FAD:protein FMN transferase [Gammaproteobacteria bacterium]|nr:FAD:protein FMN transferase [Gammaproteobacteria bacterium]
MNPPFEMEQRDDCWLVKFSAMASPCELLIDQVSRSQATLAAQIAQQEALRIEQKFSRYRNDNIIFQINHNNGAPVSVDPETAQLLDYATTCYELSDGLFDITSGVLRRAWKFDRSDHLPSTDQVAQLLPLVGWNKIIWQRPSIQLQVGMEIDLGGIGKEYAVDRTALLLSQAGFSHFLVNFGGDLLAMGPRANGSPWLVGMDRIDPAQAHIKRLQLHHGALTTSGDTYRYLEKDGVRYSHILDPHTGWPVPEAPRTVTVHASTCVEAGILATFAMLHGKLAEQFLQEQQVKHWVQR